MLEITDNRRHRPRHLESRLQQACVRWFRIQYPKQTKLLFAIPNGGRRSKVEAGIMQGEGVTSGIPDLMLAIPTRLSPGLFIEMKSENGKSTPAQREMMLKLAEAGYSISLCNSLDKFIEVVNGHMNGVRI